MLSGAKAAAAEFSPSASLSKFCLVLRFKNHVTPFSSLSGSSQVLSLRQFKCLTWVFILWELRNVSGYKASDLPSQSQQVWLKQRWLHKTALGSPMEVCNSVRTPAQNSLWLQEPRSVL